MMRKTKKILLATCLVCILTMLASVITSFHVYASEPDIAVKRSLDKIPNVINQYIDAINNNDWDLFIKSYSPERQKYYINFPSRYQIENRVGILSVDSIQIYEAKEIPSTYITEVEPYFAEINYSLYDNVHYYYIGFDYKVNEESEFFYNGVRYELVATGSIDGTDYIIGHENVYDFDLLEAFGYTFNSNAEKKAERVVIQREKGSIVNFNNENIGSHIDDNVEKGKMDREDMQKHIEEGPDVNEYKGKSKSTVKNMPELDDLEKASQGKDIKNIQPLSATRTPSTIKLYITSTGTLVNIGFNDYAKCVLPNEWYSSWKSEALKAGAITIKTYAWYNATYPRRPATDYGAHLTDRWENYQHYVPNSNKPSTDAAVAAVSGIFMRNSAGKVFDAQYRAGTQGEIGKAFGGVLSQWGTQYIATNYPEYDYYTILSYYYSFSDKSSGYIQTGVY